MELGAKLFRSRRTKMTTATMKAAVADIFQTLKQFKERVCPSGQACEDMVTFGTLAFIVWFMYVAMEPIM